MILLYDSKDIEPIERVEIYFDEKGNPVIEINEKKIDIRRYMDCSEILFGIGCNYQGIVCKRANYMVHNKIAFFTE